jgi:hypothetical protein
MFFHYARNEMPSEAMSHLAASYIESGQMTRDISAPTQDWEMQSCIAMQASPIGYQGLEKLASSWVPAANPCLTSPTPNNKTRARRHCPDVVCRKAIDRVLHF